MFFHKESDAYVMVLYLDGYEFALFRSKDLLHWEESQRFVAEKMRECPDLFELPVDNKPHERKWVFWSADGYYMVGGFDGFRFTPETGVLSAYDTGLLYAAQTYAGVSGRTVSIAWCRTKNDKGGFRGMMSVPAELSLIEAGGGLRIGFKPIRELWERFKMEKEVMPSGGLIDFKLDGNPAVVVIEWGARERASIRIGGLKITVRNTGKPTVVILDHGIIEYYSEGGALYGAVEAEEDILFKSIAAGPGAMKAYIYNM